MAASPEPTTDLYAAPVVGEYSFLCGGAGGDNPNESCLGLAPVEGGGFSLVGNKPEDAGHNVRGSFKEFQGLYRQLAAIPGIGG
ncbi:hypothetical protein ACH4S8_37265 [Streptomyces sp. NPDC021080]|uniref:hypothetical protein n=1 Tax=Streptomyces sp. NPDC021080 TaxID=3365110 RepID=UPI003787F435